MQNNVQFPIFNSVFSKECSELIDLTSIFSSIKEGKYNSDYISLARSLNKSETNYNKAKEHSKQIIWGFNKSNKQFTGYVYIDIDLTPEDNPEFIKQLLFELPEIKACWLSFGGKGVGAIIYCPYINNNKQYKQAYNSIAEYIYKNLGLLIDKKCSNFNRFNTISFDSELLLRDFPTAHQIKFNKSDNYNLYQLDSDLKLDVDLVDELVKIFEKDFYFKFIVVNKLNQKPVQFSKNLVYDSNIHTLEKYISNNIISEEEIKNNNSTLAYSTDGYSCIKHQLPLNYYFPKGKRASSLTVIGLKILLCDLFSKYTNKKQLLFNILTVLNSTRCITYQVQKGVQPVYLPLLEEEINKLTTYIYNIYIENKIQIKLDCCKSVISSNFTNNYLLENPTYTGDKHPRTLILREINQIKKQNNNFKNKNMLYDLFESYPDLQTKDYIEILSKENNWSVSYAKRKYHALKKNMDS